MNSLDNPPKHGVIGLTGVIGPANGFIDKFSPGGQAALCLGKVFGIIGLFALVWRLSTVVARTTIVATVTLI